MSLQWDAVHVMGMALAASITGAPQRDVRGDCAPLTEVIQMLLGRAQMEGRALKLSICSPGYDVDWDFVDRIIQSQAEDNFTAIEAHLSRNSWWKWEQNTEAIDVVPQWWNYPESKVVSLRLVVSSVHWSRRPQAGAAPSPPSNGLDRSRFPAQGVSLQSPAFLKHNREKEV